jgi:hypothetical protein
VAAAATEAVDHVLRVEAAAMEAEETALTLAVKAILAAAHLSSAVKTHSCSAQMPDAAAADRKSSQIEDRR